MTGGGGGGAGVVVVVVEEAPGVVTPPEPVEVDAGVCGGPPPLGEVPVVPEDIVGLGTLTKENAVDWLPATD